MKKSFIPILIFVALLSIVVITAIVDPIKQAPISSTSSETTETTLEEVITNVENNLPPTQEIPVQPIDPVLEKLALGEPLVASYDKGLDLILVDQSFTQFRSYNRKEKNPGNIYPGMYWDSNNNLYYSYPGYTIASNISYDTNNLIPEPLIERFLIETFNDGMGYYLRSNWRETGEILPDLRYLGSIDPTHRAYLDISNNVQFIKILTPMPTTYTVISKDKTTNTTDTTIDHLYPVPSSDPEYYEQYYTTYTNTNYQFFDFDTNNNNFIQVFPSTNKSFWRWILKGLDEDFQTNFLGS